jgi:1-deoxy-D-xylulose-5-phosphate synthase
VTVSVLERIASPADLRGLNEAELAQLAREIRELIIATCAKNGGHVGASMGAVEIILALHRVFDQPDDRLVFDVGHQAYAHKILTGRRDRFSTLRQRHGLSGFPVRSESPYDHYGTAHASTGVAAALGMAKARDIKGETHGVAVLVGDGALTGGLAFEALNNLGTLGTPLVVVLNDNSMSISPNVGALSAYLTRIRSAPSYQQMKRDVEHVLRAIPVVGEGTARAAERVKEGLRHVMVPGAFFEALGLRYLGPIDGHDLPLLEAILRRARRMARPVVVHVVTEKGRGFAPAAQARDRFHGGGPFDPGTGRALGTANGPPSWSEVFGRLAVRFGRSDPRVVALTAAMEDGTGLGAFHAAFPNRFFDVGIAESAAVTMAAGMAAEGMRPIVAIYSTFLQRAYDILIHDVALQRLPVLLCLDRAGLAGEDGPTHHGAFDLAYLRAVPEMVVAAPRDTARLRDLMAMALLHDGPVALRYPKGAAPGGEPPAEGAPWPLGRGEVLRAGSDVALLALGTMVAPALEAAEALAAEGVSALVADMVFAKPLDASLVAQAAALGRVVTLEEGTVNGGLGDAVDEALERDGFAAVRRLRIALPDAYQPHGTRAELLAEAELDAAGVLARLRRFLKDAPEPAVAGRDADATLPPPRAAAASDGSPLGR